MDLTAEAEVRPKRYAGILLHPTSFPSPYGIGDLGQGAYSFIDFLKDSGMTAWQVLPLGHTGFGDSPYQPFSAFAGQPLIISIDHLRELNLLWNEDFNDMPQWNPEDISYGDVIPFKMGLLRKAYKRYMDPDIVDGFSNNHKLVEEFEEFKKTADWLADYSLFMAGKDHHEGIHGGH